MSRRRNPMSARKVKAGADILEEGTEFPGHGAVEFKCPSGHELDVSAVLADGTAHLYGAEALEWLDTDGGGKFRTTCPDCAKAGRRLDLQASWPKVLELLRKTDGDDKTAPAVYVLGGRVG